MRLSVCVCVYVRTCVYMHVKVIYEREQCNANSVVYWCNVSDIVSLALHIFIEVFRTRNLLLLLLFIIIILLSSQGRTQSLLSS